MPRTSRRKSPLIPVGIAFVALLAAAVWVLESDDAPTPGSTSPLRQEELGDLEAVRAPGLPRPLADRPSADGNPPRERVTRQEPPRRGPKRIIARVLDADTGTAISTFQVTVLPAGPGDPLARLEEVPPRPFRLRDGIFAIDQEPGSYDVVVQAPGYLPGSLSGVIVPALDGDALQVPLARGAGISGSVVGTDGLVRPDLPVFLEVLRLAEPGATPPRVKTTRSGADGGFSFSPLPDGEYAVTALELDNRDDRVSGVRVYGRSTKVQIVITPRHQLSLRVQDVRGLAVPEAKVELSGEGRVRNGTSNDAGLVVLENLPDGSYSVRAIHEGFAELVEPVELSGGLGEHLVWLTLVPDENAGR